MSPARQARIRALLKRVNNSHHEGGGGEAAADDEVVLDEDAAELLDELMSRYLDRALLSGRESARRERKNQGADIRVCDLRAYTQDELGLDVLGFCADSLIDEFGVGSRYVQAAIPAPTALVGRDAPATAASLKKRPLAASAAMAAANSNKAHLDRLALKQQAIDSAIAAQEFARNAAKKKKKQQRMAQPQQQQQTTATAASSSSS